MRRLQLAGNVESEHRRTCVCSVGETNRRKQKKTYTKLICGNFDFEVTDLPVLKKNDPYETSSFTATATMTSRKSDASRVSPQPDSLPLWTGFAQCKLVVLDVHKCPL